MSGNAPIQIRAIDEMTNLAGLYRHGTAFALSDTATTRKRKPDAFCRRKDANQRHLRRPCQCSARAGEMNPARHEAVERGWRGRTETFPEDLECRHATCLETRAHLFHHRIGCAHVEARTLVQQFRIDIRHGEPALQVKAVAASRLASNPPSAPRSGATMALQTADHIWILHCQLMDVKINGVESLTQGRCGAR